MRLTLIADSGSTKTDWCAVSGKGEAVASCRTQGINPFHQSEDTIVGILREELLAAMPLPPEGRGLEIRFYGSGVTEEKKPLMGSCLQRVFPQAVTGCESDLLGAARASLGRRPGIACILGTGANSCLYDGSRILLNTPPLGYILGDEGSGACLGKLFLNAIFKRDGWRRLREEYLDWSGLSYPDIIDRVYRQPLANRYLASVAPFISQALGRPRGGMAAEELQATEELERMVEEAFGEFRDRNVLRYLDHVSSHPSPAFSGDVTIGFVGSVAHHFERQLRAAFGTLAVGSVLQSPMPGLIQYHAGR